MSFAATGRHMAAVAIGIDRFERSESVGTSLMDGEGMLPICMGDDVVDSITYSAWGTVNAEIDALPDDIDALPEGERKVFFEGMVKSLKMAGRLFASEEPSFEEEVSDLVGAPARVVDLAIVETARDNLEKLLSCAGFRTGSLTERVKAWEDTCAIDSDKLEGVFRDLMAQTRQRTGDMICDTGDDNMGLTPIPAVPYTARCGCDQGKMDQSFTRTALKHRACHEVSTGPSTQLLSTRKAVGEGRAKADALLITENAITGCGQEGIGGQGVQMIDWTVDEDDQIHPELRRLRSAAQTTAAWGFLVDGKPKEAALNYLRDKVVREVRERVKPAQRDAFIETLHSHAHRPRSLNMFSAE